MKILFLCAGNVGRSQVAEGFFNKASKNKSKSAALIRKHEGMHPLVVQVMKEKEIDISKNVSKMFTKEMLDWADKIILMSPDLLSYMPEGYKDVTEVWDIEDLPVKDKQDIEKIRELRDRIEIKVRRLINSQ